MSGVDHLIERGLADPDRMGISGSSYGGYMSSWTISQTDRFKAAVIGAPVTDLPSFVRTTDVPERFESYLGKDHRRYYRGSPMYFADKIKTPALVWHGDADIRVPLMQGRHLYTALLKEQSAQPNSSSIPASHTACRRPQTAATCWSASCDG